jgi:hypothetical protein
MPEGSVRRDGTGNPEPARARPAYSLSAAWAAASRATGRRKGEQLT